MPRSAGAAPRAHLRSFLGSDGARVRATGGPRDRYWPAADADRPSVGGRLMSAVGSRNKPNAARRGQITPALWRADGGGRGREAEDLHVRRCAD